MRRAALYLTLAIAACGTDPADDEPTRDAGALRDTGVRDAGDASDAGGTRDGGTRDGGTRDGGATDGGTEDAGPRDGGADDTCAVAGVASTCADVLTCDEPAIFRDRCQGPPSASCCFDGVDPCSVDGAPGLCLDVAACAFTSTPGRCPGPAQIQCCTDPAEACDPAVRQSPNEGLAEATWDATCPPGMVRVTDFCIDKFEASLVELDASGNEVGTWSPYHHPGAARVRAASVAFAVPQGSISGTEAGAACAEAGKRLCTDAEWLAACRGPAGTVYPYGDTREPGRCNDARSRHPAIELFGTSDPWIWNELGNACINQIPAALRLTGQRTGCESAYGAFDMMGNLHEWTADPAGTFRGGFYADTMINGEGCLYQTTAHSMGHWDYSTGFRCCGEPL